MRASFEKPRAVQLRGIIPIVKGHDVAIESLTGTGQTAAFSISILQKLDLSLKQCQVLVLVPTRGVALQTHREINALGCYMDVKCHVCIEGAIDETNLANGSTQIVVGTFEQVFKAIKCRIISTLMIKMCIFDEADEILQTPGVEEKVYDLVQLLPGSTQVIIGSSETSDGDVDAMKRLMRDPLALSLKEGDPLANVTQYFVTVGNSSPYHGCYTKKSQALSDFYQYKFERIPGKAIVFFNSCDQVRSAKVKRLGA